MISTIDGLIADASDHWPDRPALIEEDQNMTYHSVENRIRSLAGALIQLGLHPKDRVGVLCKNSISMVVAYFSILRVGATVVPLDYTLSTDELTWICEDCQFFAIYTDSALKDRADELATRTKLGKPVLDASLQALRGDLPSKTKISQDDLAFIIYTSGTTGHPLGVMLSHNNLLVNCRSVAEYLGLTTGDKACCVLPFYYIYGLSILLSHFSVGASIYIENRFLYPSVVLDAIDQNQLTSFSGVSSHYAILIRQTDFLSRKLPSVRYFAQAGDKMPVSIVERITAAFTAKKLYLMYGQTEASPRISFLSPELAAKKPGSAGKPLPGTELKIIDEKGDVCMAGQEGEITIRGKSVMLGYWHNSDETNKAIRDGWLYTGDVGYQDQDGDLHITGRIKQFLKIGGYRVSPMEIENVVKDFPGVNETAIIEVHDEILGQKVVLYIGSYQNKDVLKRQLTQLCNQKLALYKMPDDIIIMNSIPKNDRGKIDRKKMAELYNVHTSNNMIQKTQK